jgi:hypothetical protein
MNILQHISEKEHGPVLVTLNPLFPPRKDLTYGTWKYSHPQFTAKVNISETTTLIIDCGCAGSLT